MMFIDRYVTVVGNRLVTVKTSGDIEVRLVHTGQVVHTIAHGNSTILCITPVPGHSELIVADDNNGAVHLLDIGDKGTRACECMIVNAGAHQCCANRSKIQPRPHPSVFAPLPHDPVRKPYYG